MAAALRQSQTSSAASPGPAQQRYDRQDRASIVCCNNLILMTLVAESGSARPKKQGDVASRSRRTSSTSSTPSSGDLDLASGFLANAKRAVGNIELLLTPRLRNVQALLSLECMLSHLTIVISVEGGRAIKPGILLTEERIRTQCMVAQLHLSAGLFEILFSLASQCAKVLGVHQWHLHRDQLRDEEAEERRNVSYCLYTLDKAVCWTIGVSPSIPRSDVLIDPAPLSPQDVLAAHLAAKAELAAIEEAVCLELYAARAGECSSGEAQEAAADIARRLRSWLAGAAIDLDELPNAGGGGGNSNNSPESLSFAQTELALGFVCAQLLRIWPQRDNTDQMAQQRAEIARSCVVLMMRLWAAASEQGRHVAYLR